jgi:pimeloyl-ACP methyl ester carboxylesterase
MSQRSINGMNIRVRDWGQGAERALLLHCGMAQSSMWRGVVKHLDDAFSMVVPDLPGHGRSDPFPDGMDVHDAATGVARALQEDGMHLIGHSFGGTLALRLAVEAPQRVASLTLIEPVLMAVAGHDPRFADHMAREREIIATYRTGDALGAARLFNRLWGGGVPWDSFTPEVQQVMAQQMSFVVATGPSLFDDIHEILRPRGLEALTCPVTLIRGAHSPVIVQGIHEGLCARIPQACDHVVEGAGHMVVATHAGIVADQVLGNLSRTAA